MRTFLFTLQILNAIKGNCCNQNQSLENELKVCINSKEGKTVSKTCKDDYTNYSTTNSTNTSVERNTSNYTGCNGIKLKALSGSRK